MPAEHQGLERQHQRLQAQNQRMHERQRVDGVQRHPPHDAGVL